MYRHNSNWNEKNELRCLLIFKKLEFERFPKGKQMEYCREIAKIPRIGLSEGNISAKVGNYKSVAGVNNHSNASKNTQRIYKQYKNLSIQQLKRLINTT